tara:strand:+ start:1015 stop:1656 length:642 start_codon:yes stop_codon:yes gene_type:complete
MQPRISVKQVVSSVIRNLGIQDASKEFNNFVEWAFEAEKKIGSFKTFVIQETTLTVSNKQAALPDDFISIIDVKDNLDFYYQPQSKPFKTGNLNDARHRYYMSNGYIRFSNLSSGTIMISYKSLDTDEEGFPTIEANHEDAVSAYLMYKYKARDYYNQNLPRYIYVDLKNEWSRLCAQARGNDNIPSRNELRAISKYWNSIIPISSEFSKYDI